MKRAILTIFCLCLFLSAFSQSISLEPNGLQLPRFLANPACTVNDKGKQIYNTSFNKVFYCNGSSWVSGEEGNSITINPAFSVYNTEKLFITQNSTGITFDKESFDLTNNMNLDVAPINPNKFVAPVSGIYHFELSSILYFTNFNPTNNTQLLIHISKLTNSGGNAFQYYFPIRTGDDRRYINISKNIELNAGDAVNISKTLFGAPNLGYLQLSEVQFEGFLVTRK